MIVPDVKKKKERLPVIGWREWVSLPELGVEKMRAKIDTGAATSAIHVSHFRMLKTKKKGSAKVEFRVHPVQHRSHPAIIARAALVEHRHVRSSVGHLTERPVIKTILKMGESSWPIELTLVNRDIMSFRMLIGREAIKGRYLVNPGRSHLAKKIKPHS